MAAANTSLKFLHSTLKKAVPLVPPPGASVKDVVSKIVKEHELDRVKIEEVSLIISPTPTTEGSILDHNAKFDDCIASIKLEKELVLELAVKPQYVGIIVSDASPVPLETKRFLIDFYSPLNDNYIRLKRAIPSLHQHQFAFQSLGVSGIAWLNSNKTLQDINFDPITNSLVLYPLREVYKRYGQLGFVPEKTGWLYKSSGSDLDTLKKREKRWFVLTQLFLIYFHSDTDAVPSKVIPLDYYAMKRRKDDKGHPTIMLRRMSKYLQPAKTAHSGKGQLAAVKDLLTNAFPDVFVLTTDDFKEAGLTPWYDAMKSKCTNTGDRKVFGVPLGEALGRRVSRRHMIPPIITKTIAYLDQNALEVEGIFRLSGSANKIESIKDEFDLGLEVDLATVEDPHVVSGLLKQYLREMPDPLLTFAMYNEFTQAASDKTQSTEAKTQRILRLVVMLPPENQVVLKYLLGFLKRVSRLQELNKMTLQNLGTVFGPCILRSTVDDMQALVRDTPFVNEVAQILIDQEAKFVAPDIAIQQPRRPTLAPPIVRPSSPSASDPSGNLPPVPTQNDGAHPLPMQQTHGTNVSGAGMVLSSAYSTQPAPGAAKGRPVPGALAAGRPTPPPSPVGASAPGATAAPIFASAPAPLLPVQPSMNRRGSVLPQKKAGAAPQSISALIGSVPAPPPVKLPSNAGESSIMHRSGSAGDVPTYVTAEPVAPAPAPVWQKHQLKKGMVQVKQQSKPLFHPEWAVLTPTTLYLFKDASAGESLVSHPNHVLPLKGASVMREGTVFKFRSQTGNIFVFSTSNASDSEDWSSAIEECIYQVVHPLDSAELTQEELRWKQEIGFKKQDKRATRTESQLVHITQQLIQETEARKNLEEQVLRLLMRVDALERKRPSLEQD